MTPDFPKLMSQMHIGLPQLPRQVKNLLLLLCSLLVGLLPLLFWLLLILMWYYLPIQISLDMTKVTLALLLLSPFAAGFVNCRWRGRRYTLGGFLAMVGRGRSILLAFSAAAPAGKSPGRSGYQSATGNCRRNVGRPFK